MGGKRHKKPKFTKKHHKRSKSTKKSHKNTQRKAHKMTTVAEEESTTNDNNIHKKYDKYVRKISEKLDIHPNEASRYLGVAMENAFNGIMLSIGKVSNDQYYSLKEKELDSILQPSMGAQRKRSKKGKRSKRSKRR
tara:strand:+ start:232 stop:639 length:408 start_codon:yes stop_codon:yes gene_type:complete